MSSTLLYVNKRVEIKISDTGSFWIQEIDAILDKISSSGYDKLSATEKEKLFKASKD